MGDYEVHPRGDGRLNGIKYDSDEDGYTQGTAMESEADEMTQEVPESQMDDRESQMDEGDDIQMGQYSKVRTDMDVLVAKLLSRWWYVLPEWPPANYNYREQLEKKMLKCYPVTEFEDHENVDSNGYKKCYQLSAFPGVFRDFKGVAHDLRPIEGKPCYNNMIQKSREELIQLIKTAINKQISLLSNSPYDESALIERLKEVGDSPYSANSIQELAELK
ncbi:hypothetical protein BaOVIS_029190 [Babesia ovis]|uniref:Uncharacterized protein n=1 Tax=Babesia ovis TaxID=5869 RepID=A0A9W5WVX2_BABOV|nr:hypothetical protein BaOVIS_029190 [Babesia ovis]